MGAALINLPKSHPVEAWPPATQNVVLQPASFAWGPAKVINGIVDWNAVGRGEPKSKSVNDFDYI